ncbi:tetratricopeptide repeat protein [Acidomonas methanolica]|uniref:tetratricopeptide repeat-containing glycosyltransferase family protein n=1 Tax=Acidomonas methanolica TaxID=437 RepID=UPI00211A5BF5|nr:tetratricopeptide repeat-containing glycosyltransferase family protein [Acidomonas methanolica]MCQ9155570.1 glycosyltransferase family protein [Acidomonas methanolica]
MAAVPSSSPAPETLMDAMKRQDWPGARRAALSVLAREPDHLTALALLGECEMNLGRVACAWAPLNRCVRLGGQFVHRILLAICLRRLKRHPEAHRQRDLAASAVPHSAMAYFLLANSFESDGLHERARAYYEHARALNPADGVILHRLGCCLVILGEPEQACIHLRDACSADMTNANYHTDYSSALAGCGRFEDARLEAETATLLSPASRVAYHNLGHALLNLDRSEDAVAAFDRALDILPTEPRTRFSRSTALLKAGNFAEGWKDYEYRWQDCQVMRTDLSAPLWQGEDLHGKSILLHGEQGFGDSLQFIRFAEELNRRGAHVTAQVGFPLVRLFESVHGVARAMTVLPPGLRFDYHLPMASLPYRLGLTPDTIPSAPYLFVEEKEIERQGGAVRRHMTQGSQTPDLVVGLVWAGEARKHQPRAHLVDRRRSMPLESLRPLFSVEGLRFCSFQLGDAKQQIGTSGLPVVDVTDGIGDFADTAARLFGIDLLIAVDTSIVHLAGGLGLPVWMISRADGCWRWLEKRSDTPWYPTMHIFRQTSPGDWNDVAEQLRARLFRWSNTYRRMRFDRMEMAAK